MNIQPATGPQGFTSTSVGVAAVKQESTAALPEHGSVGNPQSGQHIQPPGRAQTEDAVRQIKEFVQPINDSIQFSLDDDTGFTVVKVIDLQTKEVLRQIPSEEAINIAKALDKLKGLLIHSKA
ncbi:MAG: flagellar protein FlaG [Actinomycetota bacterium]